MSRRTMRNAVDKFRSVALLAGGACAVAALLAMAGNFGGLAVVFLFLATLSFLSSK